MVMSWFNAVIWRTEFNDYVEELWGVADALNMSRLEVFAMNCADDIDLYTRSPQGSWFARRDAHAATRASLKQCSDAVLPGALLWGHNEDAGMDIDMPDASTAYIVNLTNSDTGVRYTAYPPSHPLFFSSDVLCFVFHPLITNAAAPGTRIPGSSAATRGAGTAAASSPPPTLCSPRV